MQNDNHNNNIVEELKSNTLDIEEWGYHNEFQLLSEIILQWEARGVANGGSEKVLKEIQASKLALSRIGVYVSQMQNRQRGYNVQLSRFREAKLQADAKVKEIENHLKQFDKNNFNYNAT